MTRTLFGAPLNLDVTTIDRWIVTLSRAWAALTGTLPGELEADLRTSAQVFGSGASAKTIKEKVYTLPAATDEERAIPGEALVIVDGSALITPEGRILLDVLVQLQRQAETTIGGDLQVAALSRALTMRTRSQQAWLRKQFEGTLSASPLGAALFLLINGSIGQRAAFVLPSDDMEDREMGRLVLPLIADFSARIGGKVPETTGGLRKHWVFSQVSRLLGRDVARDTDDAGAYMYVRPGREGDLLEGLADRLARMADVHKRHEAVSALVKGYRDIRGDLAAVGLMHEDPTATRRLVQRLADPLFEPVAGGR
ncbi:hypothetical protein M3693_12455 [Cellulosimicrobium funkei]|uniref:hypothetical protein n=1 Tax=Cellulosimicrobium funkei TaxID=264251 RepID=UPI00203D296D|nr:hypothetical protein [Cellulosimicrobium funkei]MCM3535027.1 hypothetical protein [Cellulosimicrobium funkei]